MTNFVDARAQTNLKVGLGTTVGLLLGAYLGGRGGDATPSGNGQPSTDGAVNSSSAVPNARSESIGSEKYIAIASEHQLSPITSPESVIRFEVPPSVNLIEGSLPNLALLENERDSLVAELTSERRRIGYQVQEAHEKFIELASIELATALEAGTVRTVKSITSDSCPDTNQIYFSEMRELCELRVDPDSGYTTRRYFKLSNPASIAILEFLDGARMGYPQYEVLSRFLQSERPNLQEHATELAIDYLENKFPWPLKNESM